MCPTDTAGRALRWCATAIALSGLLSAQYTPDWRKLGNSSIELNLASPVTGPVDAVWFSPEGDRLFAQTRSGKTFETADYERWTESLNPASRTDRDGPPPVERLPEIAARVRAASAVAPYVYALGAQVYQSGDRGRTWVNLTGYKDRSVIGPGQRDLAVSPRDAQQIVVANDFGVWRSLDGGLSWAGLNQQLPNLPVRAIVATARSGAGLRILVDGAGTAELPAGGSIARETWVATQDAGAESEAEAKRSISLTVAAEITAVAFSGDSGYAGASDGRIWVSLDRGATWNESAQRAGGGIERFFVDPESPRVALAAAAGTRVHLLRTTNSGIFWDDVTGNLPDVPAHGVTADRSSGAVYVVTDRGIFFGRMDMNVPGPGATWTPIGASLPQSPAVDVKLDSTGNQLYIALAGYGVYAAAAPHRAKTLRLVNAADLSQRAAAPGSLVSVLGGKVQSARSGNLNFPILASSDASSDIQVPFEASGPVIALALDTVSGRRNFALPFKNVSPAIFVDRDGAPMLLDADSGLMLDARNTARSRSRVQILATGLGKVKPNWPTGIAAPLQNAPAVVANVQAFLDRVPVEVTRATLAPGYVGLYLIELQLPALVNSGPAELSLVVDGQESNRVRLDLEAGN